MLATSDNGTNPHKIYGVRYDHDGYQSAGPQTEIRLSGISNLPQVGNTIYVNKDNFQTSGATNVTLVDVSGLTNFITDQVPAGTGFPGRRRQMSLVAYLPASTLTEYLTLSFTAAGLSSARAQAQINQVVGTMENIA